MYYHGSYQPFPQPNTADFLPYNIPRERYDETYDYNGINNAYAAINGGPLATDLKGTVTFQQVHGGTVVCAEIYDLPPYQPGHGNKNPIGPHGFHIHENGVCQVGDPSNPFQSAGGHWNPYNQPHGHHPGDFPVLFSNNGYANMCFFTNRFNVSDVIGKAIIIHQNPDDYRSQPSGDAGKRLACGVIRPIP